MSVVTVRLLNKTTLLIPKITHFDLFGDLYEANCVTEFQQDYLSIFKLLVKYDAPFYRGNHGLLKRAIQVKLVS